MANPSNLNPSVRIVSEIRGSALTEDEIARIVRTDPRTVQSWAAGETEPSGEIGDRLLDLKLLCDDLHSFMAPDAMESFWHSRSDWLEERRPIDVLELGEFDLVRRTISAMGNFEN